MNETILVHGVSRIKKFRLFRQNYSPFKHFGNLSNLPPMAKNLKIINKNEDFDGY
jgi:hypothetical protein